MQKFAELLGSIGPVTCFDYPYQIAGRRSPDRRETLVRAHGEAFDQLKARASAPLVLVGKSMGGRIGCHLAVELAERGPAAVVCLGYPLVGQSGDVRDEVLRALETPVLFVQGTRDPLCPLERLSAVRAQMRAENELYVVDGGDHSLGVRKGELKRAQTTQEAIDAGILAKIAEFVGARTALTTSA
jgi:predicted alpha/beta-hydrolase family hydrolase